MGWPGQRGPGLAGLGFGLSLGWTGISCSGAFCVGVFLDALRDALACPVCADEVRRGGFIRVRVCSLRAGGIPGLR